MTKVKILQIGLIISLLGFSFYKFASSTNFIEISEGSISNILLFSIIFVWVTTYLLRVVNGNMTFMEQRKRYRKKYDEIMAEKLKKEFNSMTVEEQKALLKDIEEN